VPAPPVPKKRVLLLDSYPTKRDMRARMLRQLGVDVDVAADVSEARSLWQADSYNLMLVDVLNDGVKVQEFCDEVRGAKPPQKVAFLVGQPGYLAGSPAEEGEISAKARADNSPWSETVISLFANACDALPQRWGFQEASLRIAAVRTMHDPRRVMKAKTNSKLPRFSWADAVKNHSAKAAD
jgi:CheY-like chemotaxis protein